MAGSGGASGSREAGGGGVGVGGTERVLEWHKWQSESGARWMAVRRERVAEGCGWVGGGMEGTGCGGWGGGWGDGWGGGSETDAGGSGSGGGIVRETMGLEVGLGGGTVEGTGQVIVMRDDAGDDAGCEKRCCEKRWGCRIGTSVFYPAGPCSM